MALESQFTRIKAEIDRLISPRIVGDSAKMEFIRPVLENEMPTYRQSDYAAQEFVILFRAMDQTEDRFRVLTNATFSDYFAPTNLALDAIVETVALEMGGKQLALAYVSRDYAAAGGVVNYDLCPNGDSEDAAAGFWLHGDKNVTLNWDAETLLDIYPTTSLVVKLTMTGDVKLYAVRLRLVFVGTAERLALDVGAIAKFCAARFWEQEENKQITAGADPTTIMNIRAKIKMLKAEAVGFLDPPANARMVSASAGRVVQAGGSSGSSAFWEKV